MTSYHLYYTSKNDMFVVTKDDGTLYGKYDTDIFCKDMIMADKVCDLLNNKQESIDNLKNENKRLKKIIEELNYELTEYKQSEYDNYNITDGLW